MTTRVALGLLTASLVLLTVGGFVQLDDVSGAGSDQWSMPLGLAAGVAAAGSLVVAVGDRTARWALGAAVGALVVVLTLGATLDEGFRFVYGDDEGELFVLQVALGLLALVLLAPRARFVWYFCALVASLFVAFAVGTLHFEATVCGGGDCDVAFLSGLAWAAAALLAGLLVIAVVEVRRARRIGRTGAGR